MNWFRRCARVAELAKTLCGSFVVLLLLGAGAVAEPSGCHGTALVFAIDASGSVDDREYMLQMAGLSQALRDPEVAEAVQSAGGVALAAVVWSDTAMGTSTVGWRSVRSPQDIEHFARTVESLSRVGGGGTDIGQGVSNALDLLDDPALCAMRRARDRRLGRRQGNTLPTQALWRIDLLGEEASGRSRRHDQRVGNRG